MLNACALTAKLLVSAARNDTLFGACLSAHSQVLRSSQADGECERSAAVAGVRRTAQCALRG
jgi:hypothetical protein